MQVNGSSLFIQDADCLTGTNQYHLYQLIRYHLCRGADMAQIKRLDIRVMVTANTPPERLLAEKRIRQDFYYLLSGMTFAIPPFRERPKDLGQKLEDCLKEGCKRYVCYRALTQEARTALLTYPWPGNLFQVENSCRRLILTADRRSTGEITVMKCLCDLYSEIAQQTTRPMSGGYKITAIVTDEHQMGERAREICQALCHYDGNRRETVETLEISKAILWGKMKKYEIEFR